MGVDTAQVLAAIQQAASNKADSRLSLKTAPADGMADACAMAATLEARAMASERLTAAMREASRIVRDAAADIRRREDPSHGMSRMANELSELVSRLSARTV